MAARTGDKVGPRIAELVSQYTLAARRHMAPYEAQVHQVAQWHNLSKMGKEVADHWAPILNMAAELPDDQMHPVMRQWLKEAASGKHQLKSLGGILFGGAANALSTVISNYVAPVAYDLTRLAPNLSPDPGTLANLVAARALSKGELSFWGRGQGLQQAFLDDMLEAAYSVPGAADLLDMLNRGDLSEGEVRLALERGGLRPELIGPVIASRFQLLAGADIALALLRGNVDQAQASHLAARQGITPEVLNLLVANTGEPPGIIDMVSLWRRGKISRERLVRAILQSRVRDEWVDAIELLAIQPPTTEEVLQALVQGEVSLPEAERRFAEAGGDPEWFTPAYQTRANAPSPEQAAAMANRGIIPWDGRGGNVVSFAQAFAEGRWKNKYHDAFRRLAVYLPPPREVATLAREGAVTQAQAERLWEEHGLSPELAHTYWVSAHFQRTSHVHELARSEIVALYFDQAITRPQALAMLEKQRWTPHDAEWILDIADLRRARAAHEAAVKKITALYVNYKITREAASSALHALDVPTGQADQIILFAELERAANLKTLTPAEIESAWFYNLVTTQEALRMLENDGYTPLDAWIKLSIRAKGPVSGVKRP
jgi:hypothetical protein